MTQETEIFFANLKKTELTDNERVSIRNNLMVHISEHPASAPWTMRAFDAAISRLAFFDSRSQGMRLVSATLVMALVVGVGTSYASEGALPGDLLYPIKIHINESAHAALLSSESAKAEWNTQLVSKRLKEAELLAAKDRLTPAAKAELQNRILLSAGELDKSIVKLVEEKGGEKTIGIVKLDLETSIDKHAYALDVLSPAAGAKVATLSVASAMAAPREDVRSISYSEGVLDARVVIERSIAHAQNLVLKVTATKVRGSADKALHTTQQVVSQLASSTTASSSADVHIEIKSNIDTSLDSIR